MNKILFLPLLLLCFASASLAGGSPSEIVQKYCQKDYEGVRLSSRTWQEIAPLIAWQHEQGWDAVTGISEYKIVSEEIDGDRAIVRVQFENQSGSLNENIDVTLNHESGEWKMAPPAYQPHVSQTLLCKKFNHCEEN